MTVIARRVVLLLLAVTLAVGLAPAAPAVGTGGPAVGTGGPADGTGGPAVGTGGPAGALLGTVEELRAAATVGEFVVSTPARATRPFSLVGFELPAGVDDGFVRSSVDGRRWGEWHAFDALGDDDEGPDPGSVEDNGAWQRFTEPVWTGEARWLQVAVPGNVTRVRAHTIDTLGLRVGGPWSDRVRDLLPLTGGIDQPAIVSRRGWGADERWRNGEPRYSTGVRAGTLHHTAGSNTYTREQAPAVVRAIYHYHTRVLGWNDIGYHLLVDRFGTIYEGRAGGVDRPVIGAHAGGFNTHTFGITILGNFQQAEPSRAALDAVADAVAWKFDVHEVDPRGEVTLTSQGSTRYPRGQRVRLPTLFGHRDVSATVCPGWHLYARMGPLRDDIAERSDRRPLLPILGASHVGVLS